MSQECPFVKTVTITRSICLSPQYFDQNIMEHVMSLLISKFAKKCDEEFGIFLSIERIVNITNQVSTNSLYAEFNVTFDALVAKPELGVDFDFVVDQIDNNGIFGNLVKLMRIYVPLTYLAKWSFVPDERNSEKNRFQEKAGAKVIGVGDTVKAQMRHIKFMGDRFGCLSTIDL